MSEIKSLKPGQRVKILSAPKESPHPLQNHVGYVDSVAEVRRNRAGSITYKTYNVKFGNSSVRVIEAGCLWPME